MYAYPQRKSTAQGKKSALSEDYACIMPRQDQSCRGMIFTDAETAAQQERSSADGGGGNRL